MVGEIGVHDDNKIPSHKLKPVNIRGSETELSGARFEDDAVGAVSSDKLFRDFLGSVGGAIVNNNEFPVELAVGEGVDINVRAFVLGGVGYYCSVNVFSKSQVMTGRFLRSLYVGRMTEYLSFGIGAIAGDC